MILLAAGLAWLAGCATGARRTDAAAKAAEGNFKPNPALDSRVEAYSRFATGISYDMNEEPAQALEEFYKSALANPANEPLVLEVSRRLIRGNQADKAVQLLTRARALPEASGTVNATLGQAYARLGKTELALAANRKAIEKSPRSLAAYQNLVEIYLQNNQPREALAVLDQAVGQSPVEAAYLIELAGLFDHYRQVQVAEADALKPRVIEILDRAWTLQPAATPLLLKLADDYSMLGETAKATEVYLKLLERAPDFPTVREKLTEIYVRGGDREKAAEQLKAIIRDYPTNPRAYLFLGSLGYDEEKHDEKQYAEAAGYLEKALLLDPRFEPVYYELAGLKLNLKKADEALRVLERARARFAPGFILEYYTGLAYSLLKKYPEAIKYYTSAELLAKTSETNRLTQGFYFQLGSAAERNKDYDTAEKYFRQCLELSPNFAEALNYLGYMWADLGIHLDEARVMIEKAVKLEPQNGAFQDSLGWILFKLDQPREALLYILKSLELTEEPDATLYDHLGDIYQALQQPDKARDAWKKSLDLEPSEEIHKKLKEAPGTEGIIP